jgi:CTP:molybdopterin cytidylyltransferase MocA
MKITRVVLAAGRGTRMGGPKALLLLDGRPLAARHADVAIDAGFGCVVVVRADVARILRPHLRASCVVVSSSAPDELGPAGSIHAAVAADAIDGDGIVLIGPVDQVPPPTEVLDALLAAFEPELDAVRFTRGHPVAIRAAALVAAYRETSGVAPLRDVLATLRCRLLPVPTGWVPHDLDAPEDVLRVTGAPPSFAGVT